MADQHVPLADTLMRAIVRTDDSCFLFLSSLLATGTETLIYRGALAGTCTHAR